MTTRRIIDLPKAAEMPANNDTPIAFADEARGEFRYTTVGELLEQRGIIYGHRNGETEAPTEPGFYWFRGTLLFLEKPGETSLIVEVSPGLNLDKYDGQWWGPLVPPWE